MYAASLLSRLLRLVGRVVVFVGSSKDLALLSPAVRCKIRKLRLRRAFPHTICNSMRGLRQLLCHIAFS